jgi:hypothetical protein
LRVRIVDSAKRGAANTRRIGKPSDKASGDCGRNPLRAGAILAEYGPQISSHQFGYHTFAVQLQARIVTAQRVFHHFRDF